MKEKINGKVYNTETAKYIGEWDMYTSGYFVDSLYRKRNGEFFLHSKREEESPYEQPSEYVTPLSDDEAREWAGRYLDRETCEAVFGAVEEEEADTSQPVWQRAFNKWLWYIIQNVGYYEDGMPEDPDISIEETAENMDWTICHFCIGPCGDCAQKKLYPYARRPLCEDCPPNQYGYSECTCCPVPLLNNLHHLCFKRNK